MAIPFTRANYLQQIQNFNSNDWFMLDITAKESLLQWIVDYKAHQLGLPRLCKVEISDFKDGKIRGDFNRKTHVLTMSRGLVVEARIPPYNNENSPHNVLSHKETYEALMHEFWHAIQQYVIENPKEFTIEHADLLNLNLNENQHSKFYNYFLPMKNKDKILQAKAYMLYILQPAERYAFMYADNESRLFNDDMHTLYPSDLAFIRQYSFYQFSKYVDDAKSVFQTETPFEDIDNIIRYMNGWVPHKDINQNMWQVAEITQSKDWKQRVRDMFGLHSEIIDSSLSVEQESNINYDEIER